MQIYTTLQNYFSYPFVRYAFIVGVLIALCSSLLGVILVLKRFSYIGDGLSHVAFGAMAIAMALKVTNNMLIILPVTVIAAVLLLKTGQNPKINGDALIAMISVGALAIGYLLLNLFPSANNVATDVCSTLFGATTILTLSKVDVGVCIIISLIVIITFITFYSYFFSVTFDENFATATGIKAEKYNLIIAIITALIIVVAMNLVGSLLISALIIFPALSAMRISKSFQRVTILSAFLGVLSASIGIIVSILASTPVGATIVTVNIIVFFLCLGYGKLCA